MNADKFTIFKATGIHSKLAMLAGEWEGMTKTWFDPNKLEDESEISGTMKPVLDGRFIVHEYKSSFKGQPVHGIAIIGFDTANSNYQCAWIDSYHMGTGIMFSESAAADNYSVLGSYATPGMPERWGWRTTIEQPEDDKIIISAFNISPAGEEMRATKTVYIRKDAKPNNYGKVEFTLR